LNVESPRLEGRLGRVLGLGSATSTIILAAGLVFALARPEGRLDDVLLMTGILALVVTPLARVVVSMIEFARERDWTFLLLTTVVLLVLLASWLVP
jgi:uncharacterized membrane protein